MAGGVSMKEENIKDGVEPDLSSTLSDVEATTMEKLLKEIACVCCGYDVLIRYLLEVQELGAGKDINEKMNLFLVDPLYNVRKDWSVENLEHGVFTSMDEKDVENVLGYVMRAKSHGHMFPNQSIPLSGTKLFYVNLQKRGSIASDHGSSGFESKESETFVKQPVFETERQHCTILMTYIANK